jgi:hypothetical protein
MVASFSAPHQYRIESTMFFPTPRVTIASALEKQLGSSSSARIPFGNQVYRKGNV